MQQFDEALLKGCDRCEANPKPTPRAFCTCLSAQETNTCFPDCVGRMSRHERQMVAAQMGNIRDVNPTTMKQGVEEWQEAGGSGFVSQFAAYAGSKPGSRSKG